MASAVVTHRDLELDSALLATLGVVVLLGLLALAGVSAAADWWRARG